MPHRPLLGLYPAADADADADAADSGKTIEAVLFVMRAANI